MPKPIVISCGDPAGIGIEVAVKAWNALRGEIDMVWAGDPAHLPKDTPWAVYDSAAAINTETLSVLAIDFGTAQKAGQPNPAHAASVIDAINICTARVIKGEFSTLCTAPINKQILKEGANFAHLGHTEYLQHLTGAARPVMMLACPELRVVPLTIHIPIKDVPAQITDQLLFETVDIIHNDMRDKMGITQPRIRVAGLNPHASEGGKIGREDIDIITPAISQMQARGIDIQGPFSADTMFHKSARSQYDVALCMYHDQALIPIKTIDFAGGANVTLGLPIIRTSPDHGTAFDIAGRGIADPASMIAALRMAHDLSKAK